LKNDIIEMKMKLTVVLAILFLGLTSYAGSYRVKTIQVKNDEKAKFLLPPKSDIFVGLLRRLSFFLKGSDRDPAFGNLIGGELEKTLLPEVSVGEFKLFF